MIINIKDLTKSYSQGSSKLEVLNHLNFEIDKPKSVAIIGKSGSGKSTFLSLGAGLDKPNSGQIIVHNKDLVSMNENELALFRAKHIGIIFQQFHLMQSLTALENVLLPLEILQKENAKEIALDCLEKVGLADRGHHFPHELSGGEKQRIAIARAIAPKPNLIFADEPSGNLDDQTGIDVMNLLFDLVENSKTTLILVTHDNELAKKCDEMYILKNHGLEKL